MWTPLRRFEAGPDWPGVVWSVDDQVVADIQARAWVNPSQANIETSRKFAMAAIVPDKLRHPVVETRHSLDHGAS